MENMKSIEEFIKENNIKIIAKYADSNPHMTDFRGDHWKVTLKGNGKQFTLYYSKGYGHKGAEPIAAEVLDCLASDAAGFENARNFEDWASDYGYDPDSRKAERIYQTIRRQAVKLEKFLDNDKYKELLWETERM